MYLFYLIEKREKKKRHYMKVHERSLWVWETNMTQDEALEFTAAAESLFSFSFSFFFFFFTNDPYEGIDYTDFIFAKSFKI
jgi:hypothetical protein